MVIVDSQYFHTSTRHTPLLKELMFV